MAGAKRLGVRREAKRHAAFRCARYRGKAPSPLRSARAVQNLHRPRAAALNPQLSTLNRSLRSNTPSTGSRLPGAAARARAAQHQVSGTIDQPDAGGPMTGGTYTLTGGFWSIITVVQTPGAKNTLSVWFAGFISIIWWFPCSKIPAYLFLAKTTT